MARARLMESNQPVIYVADGCTPGKDTVPMRYAMETLGAGLAAVAIEYPVCRNWAELMGRPQRHLLQPSEISVEGEEQGC